MKGKNQPQWDESAHSLLYIKYFMRKYMYPERNVDLVRRKISEMLNVQKWNALPSYQSIVCWWLNAVPTSLGQPHTERHFISLQNRFGALCRKKSQMTLLPLGSITRHTPVSYTHLEHQEFNSEEFRSGEKKQRRLDPIFVLKEYRRGSGEFEQFIILCDITYTCVRNYLGNKQ